MKRSEISEAHLREEENDTAGKDDEERCNDGKAQIGRLHFVATPRNVVAEDSILGSPAKLR